MLMPHYVQIAADLRKLLPAPSIFEVVPAVKRLQADLHQHKQTASQMQSLIQQLCAALGVGEAEALLPSVQALVSEQM